MAFSFSLPNMGIPQTVEKHGAGPNMARAGLGSQVPAINFAAFSPRA
jgi:hypothetical protein